MNLLQGKAFLITKRIPEKALLEIEPNNVLPHKVN